MTIKETDFLISYSRVNAFEQDILRPAWVGVVEWMRFWEITKASTKKIDEQQALVGQLERTNQSLVYENISLREKLKALEPKKEI